MLLWLKHLRDKLEIVNVKMGYRKWQWSHAVTETQETNFCLSNVQSKLLQPAERAAELMTRIVLKVSFTEGTVGHFTWFETSAVTRSKFISCIVFFEFLCWNS